VEGGVGWVGGGVGFGIFPSKGPAKPLDIMFALSLYLDVVIC